MAIQLDEIDKRLWQELGINCRSTYKYLGEKLGVSANAAKKRVERLVDGGFIQGWLFDIMPAMIDAQFAFIEVKTDGRQDQRQFVETLGDNPMIYVVLPLTTGDYVLHAYFIGATGLLELGSFIRKVEGVIDVKVHPTMADLGSKMELGSLQLRVMPWLLRDPRMSVNDIARNSGLTTRRVRKIINELVESESFNFSFYWNPNAGDSMAFIARIEYDSQEAKTDDIEEKLRQAYPVEYFYSHVSAIEAVMFSVFMVDHLLEIEEITKAIRDYPGVASLNTMIYYSATILTPLTRFRLEEMLTKEGLWP